MTKSLNGTDLEFFAVQYLRKAPGFVLLSTMITAHAGF